MSHEDHGLEPTRPINPSPRNSHVTHKRPVTVRSPEDYSQMVNSHANPHSAQSLYSGANYANLAAYLRRPYELKPSLNGRVEPGQVSPFATVHDLNLSEHDEGRIKQFHTVEAFGGMIREKKAHLTPRLLVFLRGHPSPEWLNAIGHFCDVDPEFFHRHLNFRIAPTDKHFTSPGLPSTSSNIVQLRLTSIIYCDQTQRNRSNIDQLRKDTEEEMKRYSQQLKKENNMKIGNSIVRSFTVHDESHSILEQDVSICVNEFKKGWIGVAWLDNGNDLSEGPVGPWSSLRQRSGSWKTIVIPTILHRPAIALKTPYISPRQIQHERDFSEEVSQPKYAQLAGIIHTHYGRFLNENVARSDAFYAFSELFSFMAASEVQFLNMIEEKIAFETTRLLETDHTNGSSQRFPQNSTLPSLWSSKKILDEHLWYLRRTRDSIDRGGGPKWPRATENEPKVYTKVKITREMLLRDYDYLLERAKILSRSCDRWMDVAGNNALVAESRSAMAQTGWVAKLTLLAFFFIPASFTTSLFGMNFVQFDQGTLSIWIWVIVLVPTYAISLFMLYFDFGRLQKTRALLAKMKLHRKRLKSSNV